jgi:16S rRNA (guanine(966)-N(2))-methyltransferase RsmD
MRIIAGKYRSRVVKPFKGPEVRPTADKVKGALFNMLEPWDGVRLLDLYAGTGNLGIEAISRGATEVVFVEKELSCVKLIRENLESLGLKEGIGPPAIKVLHQTVGQAFIQLHQAGKKFDVILADPPYSPGAGRVVQNFLHENPILAPGGILAIEHGEKDPDLTLNMPGELVRQKKYGETYLSLFRAPLT